MFFFYILAAGCSTGIWRIWLEVGSLPGETSQKKVQELTLNKFKNLIIIISTETHLSPFLKNNIFKGGGLFLVCLFINLVQFIFAGSSAQLRPLAGVWQRRKNSSNLFLIFVKNKRGGVQYSIGSSGKSPIYLYTVSPPSFCL